MGNKNKIKNGSGNIGRRDFICKSALVCCLANFPFAISSLSKFEGGNTMGINAKPTELASYCCLYCGACDIYQQNIGRSGKELKRLLDAFGFNRWVTKEPGFENYESFYEILNNIIATYGKCSGCKKGGGDTECQMRSCCLEKGYQTCAECEDAPCEILKTKIVKAFPNWTEDFQELKKIGLKAWIRTQQEKVDKGLTFSEMLTKKPKDKN